jgi:hypothetical protein
MKLVRILKAKVHGKVHSRLLGNLNADLDVWVVGIYLDAQPRMRSTEALEQVKGCGLSFVPHSSLRPSNTEISCEGRGSRDRRGPRQLHLVVLQLDR